MLSDFLAVSDYTVLKINHYFLCFQLRAQNQVLKKGVVDEQANSAALKVYNEVICVVRARLVFDEAHSREFTWFSVLKSQL